MKRPSDWDQVKAYEERRRLPAGGYICEIKNIKEDVSKTGKPMVVVALDIAEGDYKGYFMDEHMRSKDFNPDAKWPFAGTKWILQQDYNDPTKTNRMLKGFVGAVEAENVNIDNGKELDFSRAKGALVGVVFREEEKEGQLMNYWTTVPNYFVSCEDIRTGNFRVPEKKPLAPAAPIQYSTDIPDSFQQAVDDIPF